MALEIRLRIIDLPFDAAKSIDASCVSTPARSLITWFEDRRAYLDGRISCRRVGAPPAAEGAIVLAHENDSAIGLGELEEGEQDLVEQAVEIAFEADVARELPGDSQPLVVERSCCGSRPTKSNGEKPFAWAAICVPIE